MHAGDVVVIRNIGPKGAPGMPEMLKPTGAIIGAGLGKSVALITDEDSVAERMVSWWATLPLKLDGGPIALVEDNDIIEIDAAQQDHFKKWLMK